MTNELEKQFFDTFGIEPKYESHSCDGWGRTVEIKYFKDKKDADKFGMVFDEPKYPQITDRILLKLICILSIALKPAFVFPRRKTVLEMKEWILQACITQEEGIYTRVQALFKE